MKLQQSHLKIALGLLAAAILYNIWVFSSRPRPSGGPTPAPLLAEASVPSPPPAPSGAAPVDPATIPAPPGVDVKTAPSWAHDPFLRAGEDRRDREVQVVKAVPSDPDPVVRSILFSPDRKLAVIQGRIYKVGDKVGSSEIVDIERAAVVIRTAAGETRRVELQSPAARWMR